MTDATVLEPPPVLDADEHAVQCRRQDPLRPPLPATAARPWIRPEPPASAAATRECDLCGGMRTLGTSMAALPDQPPLWACDDCRRMLLLCVDDHGTPGD